MSVFLTGTDTGVGKTHTAVQLLRLARTSGLRCVGYKPICCGDRGDAEQLLAAGSDGVSIDEVNPLWLQMPAAPLPAAQAEGVEIDTAQLLEGLARLQVRFEFVVVEGVGGWLVPILRDYFVSDLAREMKLPVLVVVLNRLGCLNHTLMTVRGIAAEGLECAGIVLNSPGAEQDAAMRSNRAVLEQVSDTRILPGLSPELREMPPEWAQMVQRLRTGALTL